MPNFLLAPDAFKGSLTALEVCEIMEEVIKAEIPGAETKALPIADGGEGSLDAFLMAAGGRRVRLEVCGPRFEPVEAAYAVLRDGSIVIELAEAAGLPLMGDSPDVLNATTFGVGELMAHALRQSSASAPRLYLCLGGSAANDAACGAAAALGFRFLDEAGRDFVPTGKTLINIAAIERSAVLPELEKAEIIVMSDVDNPLYGKDGAAAIFAPQKGAAPADIPLLDRGLRHFAALIRSAGGPAVADLKGAGAAGGFGAGAAALFGGTLKPGIESILDLCGFDRHAARADFILTGEGRLDGQSVRGKAVAGIAARARRLPKPLIAVVGDIEKGIEPLYERGLLAAFSINRRAVPFSEAKKSSREDMKATLKDLMRLLRFLMADKQ
mgnify:CR=1 FL=1